MWCTRVRPVPNGAVGGQQLRAMRVHKSVKWHVNHYQDRLKRSLKMDQLEELPPRIGRFYVGRMRQLESDKSEDYWRTSPTEFRTQQEMMKPHGAGFVSMWEDYSPRARALTQEFNNENLKPPLEPDYYKRNARRHPTAQEFYHHVPELRMLHSFKAKHPTQTIVQDHSRRMHPLFTQNASPGVAQTPIPLSAKLRDPFPKSNLRHIGQAPREDSRVQ
eukprot:Sspe_Gene.106872::Locus_84942_Transcript_1_1_Confidence_1.000_Length_762::g.106872::m.106872